MNAYHLYEQSNIEIYEQDIKVLPNTQRQSVDAHMNGLLLGEPLTLKMFGYLCSLIKDLSVPQKAK